MINADGSGATNVGARPQGVDEIIPSWAPDRDALAWWADGIILLEEGADPVDDLAADGVPVWSPDGQFLATTTDSIVVMDLDGTVQMTVAGPASDIAWQPLFD